MAKELQVTQHGGVQVTTSMRAELRREILDEVSSLEIVMRKLYFRFITVHKSVVHLNSWQQCCARRACILLDLHTSVDHMEIWTMRYKGCPFHFPKMMKPKGVELKAHIWSQIQNYEELLQFITSLKASHARVFRSMDVIMHVHAIPFIGTHMRQSQRTKSDSRWTCTLIT